MFNSRVLFIDDKKVKFTIFVVSLLDYFVYEFPTFMCCGYGFNCLFLSLGGNTGEA